MPETDPNSVTFMPKSLEIRLLRATRDRKPIQGWLGYYLATLTRKEKKVKKNILKKSLTYFEDYELDCN